MAPHGMPWSGPAPDALGQLAVGAARLFEGALLGEGDHAVQLRVKGLEAIEVENGQLLRGDGPRAHQIAEFRNRQKRELRVAGGTPGQPRPADAGNLWPVRQGHSGQHRLKLKGRRNRVVDRDLPQGLIIFAQVIEPLEHQLALAVGKIETGESLRPLQGLETHRSPLFDLGPQQPWQRSPSKPERRKEGREPPPIETACHVSHDPSLVPPKNTQLDRGRAAQVPPLPTKDIRLEWRGVPRL